MQINLDDWVKFPAQNEVYNDLRTKLVLMSGGLGSGKSHVGVRKAISMTALNQGYSHGFLCPSYADFRKDIKPLFEEILQDHLKLEKNKHWWFHETHKEYTFAWNRKPLFIFTAENPIAGPNLAGCVINEFSLMKWERVNEMLRRVRVKHAPYKQKVLVGTPEDVYGWLEEFVETQEALNLEDPRSFKIVYADTSENTEVDSDYRKILASMLDEQQLKIFASGQIVKIGSDYFYYSYDRSKNVTEEAVYHPGETVHVALDFNVGKMSATFNHLINEHDEKKKELHCFDELQLTGDSNTYSMRDALLARFKKEEMIVTCDASGNNRSTSALKDVQTDVAILRKAGITVRFKTVNVGMRKRQVLMNGLLHHAKIKINPKCKKTIKDYAKVKQRKEDFTKDKSNEELTHFTDGHDYLCDFEFKIPERPGKGSVTSYRAS